jgi:hypothetical protein
MCSVSKLGSSRSRRRFRDSRDDDYDVPMSQPHESTPYVTKAAVEAALRATEAERQQAKKDGERARQRYLEARERLRKLRR